MMRFSRFKTVAVLLLALSGFLYAMPSMLSPETREAIRKGTPSFVPAWLVPHQAIVLGLDLQGGSHVLLEVDTATIVRTQVNGLRDDVRRILREEKIALTGGIGVQARGVNVRVTDGAERARLMVKLREMALGPVLTRGTSAPKPHPSRSDPVHQRGRSDLRQRALSCGARSGDDTRRLAWI